MAVTKSKKAAKYTYAERVLGAFSLVQKEHKKHAIHIATLRAQVKKTAQERKDKLGPQWSNWVGKAVQKLEEEGLFAKDEHASTVALTDQGKKLIAQARRTLFPSTSTSAQEEEEDDEEDRDDQVWRLVTQNLASATSNAATDTGTPRTQRSLALGANTPRTRQSLGVPGTRQSVAFATPRGRQSLAIGTPRTRQSVAFTFDINATTPRGRLSLAAGTPRTRQSTGTKRARRASGSSSDYEDRTGTGKKRARLSTAIRGRRSSVGAGLKPVSKMTKAELLQELRAAHADLTIVQEDLKTVQQAVHDETDAWDEELRLREEIDVLRAELEEVRRVAGAKAKSGAAGPSSSRAPDETRTEVDEDNDSRAETPDFDLPPTSSPTRPRSQRQLGVTRTQSGSFISRLSKHPTPAPSDADTSPDATMDDTFGTDMGMDVPEAHGTPDHDVNPFAPAPSIPEAGSREEVLSKEVEKYKVLAEEAEAREKSFRDQVTSLAGRLDGLQGVTSEREGLLSDVTTLRTEIEEFKQLKSNMDSIIARKDAQVLELTAERENLIQVHESSLAALVSGKDALAAQIDGLQKTLGEKDVEIKERAASESRLESTLAEVKAQLKSERSANEMLLQQKTALELEIRSHVDSADAVKKGLDEQRTKIEELVATIGESTTRETSLRSELAEAHEKTLALTAEIQAAQAANAELRLTMQKAAQATAGQFQAQLSSLDAALAQKDVVEKKLEAELTESKAENATYKEQVESLMSEVDSLEGDLEDSKQEIRHLTARVTNSGTRLNELFSQLVAAEGAMEEQKISLRQAQSEVSSLSDELKRVQTDAESRQHETASQMTSKDEENRLLSQELAKQAELLVEFEDRLKAATEQASNLALDVATKEQIILDLTSELATEQAKAQAADVALNSTQEQRDIDNANFASRITELEALLATSQSQVDTLSSQLGSLSKIHTEVQTQSEHRKTEMTGLKIRLNSESTKASALEKDLAAAIGRMQEAEEKIADLRRLSQMDEATIKGLKDIFTRLRDAQFKSLQEADDQVTSAHPSHIFAKSATEISPTI